MTGFEHGDEVRLATPYAIDGRAYPVGPKVGTLGKFESAEDEQVGVVSWRDATFRGKRRVDLACLALTGPTPEEVEAAVASILKASDE